MRALNGSRLAASKYDHHVFMCDLIYFEGPLLSLFRDHKQNWLYLWCDTDAVEKERWMLFPVSRQDLLAYFGKTESLHNLVCRQGPRFLLDYTNRKVEIDANGSEVITSSRRHLVKVNSIQEYAEYVPAQDSYFDETMAPNVSLTREFTPTGFDVPITGDWFVNDLDNFSNVYTQLYAFFYCSKPQFITDIGDKVQRFLKSPWQGGFSRVNLFDALGKLVPSIHDLKIRHMRYASPGEITIEALNSVGDLVRDTTLNYLSKQEPITRSIKAINVLLNTSKLKKVDLSAVDDNKLTLPKHELDFLRKQITDVINDLNISTEWSDIVSRSPNIIVSSKVLLSVVSRIERLAEFEKNGLLDLTRQPREITGNH